MLLNVLNLISHSYNRYIKLHDATINNLNGYEDYTFVTSLDYNTI